MAQTYRPSVITAYVVELLMKNKAPLGLKAIYYGDQQIIAKSPAVCIEPARAEREYSGTSQRTDNTIELSLLVYVTGKQGTEEIQRRADTLTEAIEDMLHKDALGEQHGGTCFGGLVYLAQVTTREYGYRVLKDELMRANRIILTCKTRTGLVQD